MDEWRQSPPSGDDDSGFASHGAAPAPAAPERPSRPRSLLAQAGVIGAEELDPDDPGNPFIPNSPEPEPRPVEHFGDSVDVLGPVPTESVPPPLSDAWSEEGIPPEQVPRWERVGADPTTAATLRRLGVDPAVVAAVPVTADELVGWLWHGFTPDQVVDWLPTGSVRVAARRRNAGLGPPPR